jgi:hydrogenase maturation protease
MNSTPTTSPYSEGVLDGSSQSRVLLVGIGNEFRHDDAVGILAMRKVKELKPLFVEVIEESGEGTALMEAWNEADAVILVDAVSSHGTPGTIDRLDLRSTAIPKDVRLFSTHAFGVAQAVELARSMGSLPAKVILLGVEGSDFSPGSGLSFEVQAVMSRLEKMILDELSALALPP